MSYFLLGRFDEPTLLSIKVISVSPSSLDLKGTLASTLSFS